MTDTFACAPTAVADLPPPPRLGAEPPESVQSGHHHRGRPAGGRRGPDSRSSTPRGRRVTTLAAGSAGGRPPRVPLGRHRCERPPVAQRPLLVSAAVRRHRRVAGDDARRMTYRTRVARVVATAPPASTRHQVGARRQPHGPRRRGRPRSAGAVRDRRGPGRAAESGRPASREDRQHRLRRPRQLDGDGGTRIERDSVYTETTGRPASGSISAGTGTAPEPRYSRTLPSPDPISTSERLVGVPVADARARSRRAVEVDRQLARR